MVPPEVLKAACSQVVQPTGLTVDNILDVGRKSQAAGRDDLPPLAVVNRIGLPRATLPTLLSFPGSHAYCPGGPGLVWDEESQQLVEPNANERECAMRFSTGTIAIPEFSKATRRQLLGQVMDLNCLTWVISLGLAEQRRIQAMSVTSHPLKCLLRTRRVQVAAGGGGVREGQPHTFDYISHNPRGMKQHPWTSWDVIGEQVATAAATM